MVRTVIALSLVLAATACKSSSTSPPPTLFRCVDNSQCSLHGQQGLCVPTDGVCAFPDSSCESGYRYDASAGGPAGICVPPHSVAHSNGLGEACSKNDDCESANCVDGVCCDSDCVGACRSCSLSGSSGHCTLVGAGEPDIRSACVGDGSACGLDGTCDGAGNCRYAPGTKICGPAQLCVNGTVTTAPHCDGAGKCGTSTSRPCDPYVCKADASDCETACTTGGQCKPPNTCTSGSCGKSGLGAACSVGSDCLSGNCVDGVCCSTASCAACNACNLNGAGTCAAIGSGQADTRCGAAQPQSSCGITGACDGAGHCAYWPAGTVCGSPHCDVNIAYTNTVTCPGNGAACPTQGTTNCGAYRCYLNSTNAPTCYTDCGNTCGALQSPYCAPGHQCKNCTMIGFGMCQ